jgi:hypothetical protein
MSYCICLVSSWRLFDACLLYLTLQTNVAYSLAIVTITCGVEMFGFLKFRLCTHPLAELDTLSISQVSNHLCP